MTEARGAPYPEHLLRDLTPHVLGAVVRRCGDFAAAEDAVQDALLAAVTDWPARGVPDNPGGWLFHVACRRLADQRDAERARARREARAAADRPEASVEITDRDEYASAEDDTLALLFLCCHPSLTPASAIALTLRAVGGLSTAAIARAFLVSEPALAQRIGRAKQTIRDAGATFTLPDAAERNRRLGSVLQVLYLMFNEGHTTALGPALHSVELCTEAIRLTRLLHGLLPDQTEVAGLLALLLLTDARREARTGPRGELIPLHEQDRTLWNRAAIAEGVALVTNAIARGSVGTYQIQAAIASLHAEAASLAATDWPQILALYTLLLRMADNPMVALNRAIAAAMVHGPAHGLRLLDALGNDARLRDHFRLHAVRAHLCEMAGDRAAALRHFRAAATGATNTAERDYLRRKARALEQH
ncbi:MAG: RNA polymerase sigma factor [Planctomycetes bacterium]|nr:RNA polymerase sigma factor [Planctomycetota bacterium]